MERDSREGKHSEFTRHSCWWDSSPQNFVCNNKRTAVSGSDINKTKSSFEFLQYTFCVNKDSGLMVWNNERLKGWITGWMKEWMKEWKKGWMTERMIESMDYPGGWIAIHLYRNRGECWTRIMNNLFRSSGHLNKVESIINNSINQSNNQSYNQTINLTFKRSIFYLFFESINLPLNHLTIHLINTPFVNSINHSFNQSINHRNQLKSIKLSIILNQLNLTTNLSNNQYINFTVNYLIQ